jgi:hypothetical protein
MNFLRGSWKLLILGQGSFGHRRVMTLNKAKFKALWIRDSRYAATFRAVGQAAYPVEPYTESRIQR